MRHPIHPMLVHFPVATLFLATLGDIASLFMDEQVSRIGWGAARYRYDHHIACHGGGSDGTWKN